MKKTTLFLLLFIPFMAVSQRTLIPLKWDEFDSQKDWWAWHKDGSAGSDADAIRIENGCLIISLRNPAAEYECNVGLSDEQNIYGKKHKILRVETRLKVLNEMIPGSRGWGFWKAARNGKASSLAWFMEQLMPGQKKLSWRKAGSLSHKKRAMKNIDFNVQDWHVYTIERDIPAKTVRYYVDGNLWFQTPGIVPKERMSFHLWVDNQVYSKKGIRRVSWQGSSAILVDYVHISGTASSGSR